MRAGVRPDRFHQRGLVHGRFNNWKDAQDDFKRAVELDTTHVDAHFERGRALQKQGQLKEAIRSFSRMIELVPNREEAFHYRGHASQSLSRWADALADYERASELNPQSWKLHEHRGKMLSQLKRWEEAAVAFTTASQLAPDDWDRSLCLWQRSTAYYKLQEFARALADARQAFELDPENYWRSSDLAWKLAVVPDLRLRDADRAAALAQHSLDLYRQNGAAWRALGVAHYRLGQWDEALGALQESMHIRNGGGSYDWLLMAMIHHRQGRTSEARRWYDKSNESIENNPPVDTEWKRLHTEMESLFRE